MNILKIVASGIAVLGLSACGSESAPAGCVESDLSIGETCALGTELGVHFKYQSIANSLEEQACEVTAFDGFICERLDVSKTEDQISNLQTNIGQLTSLISEVEAKKKNDSFYFEVSDWELEEWKDTSSQAQDLLAELKLERVQLLVQRKEILKNANLLLPQIKQAEQKLYSVGCKRVENIFDCDLDIESLGDIEKQSIALQKASSLMDQLSGLYAKHQRTLSTNNRINFREAKNSEELMNSLIKVKSISIHQYKNQRNSLLEEELESLVQELNEELPHIEVSYEKAGLNDSLAKSYRHYKEIKQTIGLVLDNQDDFKSKYITNIVITDKKNEITKIDYWAYSENFFNDAYLPLFLSKGVLKSKYKSMVRSLVNIDDEKKVAERDTKNDNLNELIEFISVKKIPVKFSTVLNNFTLENTPIDIDLLELKYKLDELITILEAVKSFEGKKHYDNKKPVLIAITDKLQRTFIPTDNCKFIVETTDINVLGQLTMCYLNQTK